MHGIVRLLGLGVPIACAAGSLTTRGWQTGPSLVLTKNLDDAGRHVASRSTNRPAEPTSSAPVQMDRSNSAVSAGHRRRRHRDLARRRLGGSRLSVYLTDPVELELLLAG